MHGHLPHPVTPATAAAFSDAFIAKKGKRRGSYNCGRCGQPKKGHICHLPPPPPADSTSAAVTPTDSLTSLTDSPLCTLRSVKQKPCSNLRRALTVADLTSADVTPADSSTSISVTAAVVTVTDTDSPLCSVRSVKQKSCSNLRRALSFDDVEELVDSDDDIGGEEEELIDEEVDIGSGKLPVSCLWEVMRRLPPPALLSAAKVCTGWRDVSKRLWKAAEELRLRVPANIQVGYVGSVLQKCPALVRLSLTMQSDMDSTMLACIAFACPNLESLEIVMCEGSFNRITGGDELGRFVADKRCLTTLKMEGCSNLGAFVLCSNTLSTLWLSDLHSLSKMVFNLPNLNEISLDFSRQENDSTDLASMMDGLGRSCPKLNNIHIASLHLSHSVVLSLTAAQLRELRMLSLVLGSEITDASVAAISKCYSNLELLDLSGSSISDSGLGMICNVFPETLTRLLVALCPNITSSGIQFATAQLPLLELIDCGMTICEENSDSELQTSPNSKAHLTYQKLFIKHARLKKLSLWGCSSLDSLYLSCPNLSDLNLNTCKNLIPEKLVLQCPKVESVHAVGCQDVLIQAVQTQVSSGYAPLEDRYSRKRMADGSKRVGIPFSFSQQLPDYDKNGWEARKRRRCIVQVE
ncbi:putative F-box domain, leucine-rich repeat domain superfamily, F-box-like domain superfamily [Helianthus annuus]|nr:putative F-box domain, leucine-rich repeat domain superfamily, F-box-like domain superfamily [Helianthus annuus]